VEEPAAWAGVTSTHVLSVVIPAYNEERYIATTLERVLAVDLSIVGFSREVIVVDDHSSDRTPVIAGMHSGVSVHRLPRHAGKGGAVRAAVALARGDYLVIQDADLEYDPEAFVPMLRALAGTGADAVYGSRYLHAGRHPRQSRLAYLGGRSLSVAVKLLTGRWLSDVTTALKLLPLPLIRSLGLSSAGFELEAEITAKLLARGCRIVEVPVSYHPRTRREGKKVAFRDLVRSVSALVRFRRG
jgi:glycosyltransferase involved in cell wall biosynthesis